MNDYFYIITSAVTLISCIISYKYGIATGTKNTMDYLIRNGIIEVVDEEIEE